jgi:hypothetical protein
MSGTIKLYLYSTVNVNVLHADTAPPTFSMLSDVTLACGADFSPMATGIPTATDNEDPNPDVRFVDQSADMCTTRRVWNATDNAGNSALLTQTITFMAPQPPLILTPSEVAIPCGSIEDAIQNTERANLTIIHPCERPVNVSFTDSTTVDRCGFTLTRTWVVQDDCGTSSTFQQNIRVLDQQLPDSPTNGQINTRLDEPLLWPQFPGSIQYKVYVWMFGTERPPVATAVVENRQYIPSTNYPPGTQLLWQIEYITGENITIPSPVWGFETQSFPDLSITDVDIPPVAFSGQQFDVSWTVINVGNLSIGASIWFDRIYLGRSPDFSMSRIARTVQQRRFVDPQDGYTSQTTINLAPIDIGNFYIFFEVDVLRQVYNITLSDNLSKSFTMSLLYIHTHIPQINDIDRSNNRRTGVAPVQVNLTPPPNLVVEEIVTPTSTFSGTYTALNYVTLFLPMRKANTYRRGHFCSMDH